MSYKDYSCYQISDYLSSEVYISILQLWTHGVVPSVVNEKRSYYPGGIGIPAPLRITRYSGNSTVQTLSNEILGFTKMNWNSFNLYTKLPATIDTSNTLAQVSHLLRHKSEQIFDYRLFI